MITSLQATVKARGVFGSGSKVRRRAQVSYVARGCSSSTLHVRRNQKMTRDHFKVVVREVCEAA